MDGLLIILRTGRSYVIPKTKTYETMSKMLETIHGVQIISKRFLIADNERVYQSN